ncbi:MAG TPA: caspase family protein [Candidatus Cloacimonadota bacterium]|nr:caspase family protein [Candidatus Cloacimonadota bacterium]
MTKYFLIIIILVLCASMSAGLIDEARALKGWIGTPFSATALEAERDARLRELQNPVKGEFETNAMFEQRKKDIEASKASIQREYMQKIADARAAHEANLTRLQQRLNQLLSSSREIVTLKGTLGKYDTENQRFPVSISAKTFQITVPLSKGPEVKDNFSSYDLKVTRQLNQNLDWDYLEATLVGQGGSFSSTDKAPTLSPASTVTTLIPPDLSASVSFSEPSGNQRLDAEETAQVTITITNRGQGSGNMVEAAFELLNAPGVSFARDLYFGEIKAGQTQSKTLQLVAGMDTADTQATLKIKFSEQNGFPPDDKVLVFETKALQAPELYIADIGIVDFSGNNKIEPGEPVEVTVRVHNRGQGKAKGVVADIKRGEGVFFASETSGSFNLGDMDSGAYRDVKFNILTNKTTSKLEVKLDLKESRSQFSQMNLPLNLAFNRVERTADQMVVTGKNTQQAIANAPSLSIDIEQNIPQRSEANSNRWGVILGIETYRNVPPVRFAKRDAETMRDYFTKVLGIPAANLYIKSNEEASLGEFKTIFDAKGWLSKNAGAKDSEIYIYFSGHGVPTPDGKQAYLLPYDGNPNYAQSTAYDLASIYQNLGAIPAKSITMFLDSCFSGANRDNEIILADARPVFLSSAPSVSAPHLAVFSASSGSQISSAWADMQHGLFSYFLMKGLQGEADGNQDKRISQNELHDYVSNQVKTQARRMGREQEPQLQSGDPTKVIVQW